MNNRETLFENLKTKPLAFLLRPHKFNDFIGQRHLVGKNGILRKLIEKDKISSLILWGPPGCGKTSLAYLISKITKSNFEYLSAVTSTLKDLKKIIKKAQIQKTILCVDEVHRWSRSQQAALLPYVENGTLIFIGITTENPYFEVISPLLSRSAVYRLNPLKDDEIGKILERAEDFLKKKGTFKTDHKALNYIAKMSSGDARRAINILEAAFNYSQTQKPPLKITSEIIENIIQKRALLYDKDRDAHYDTISAFIKSMRGSDPDAAVFYLVKMLQAGEDPEFIARRILILASEDIGNADPNAINVAASAFEAVSKVGMPEAEFALAQATLYMATAPKSNSTYKALVKAKKDLQNKGAGEIPLHLRNPSHPGLKKHHYGKDYKYPHLYEEGFVPKESYLPDHLKGAKYYEPTPRGYEKIIKARLEFWRKLKKTKVQKGIECKLRARDQ